MSQLALGHCESLSVSQLERRSARLTHQRGSAFATDSGHLTANNESVHAYESATTRLNKEHIFRGHEPGLEMGSCRPDEPADTFLVYSKQEEVHTTLFQDFVTEDGHFMIEDVIKNSVVLLNVRETNLQKLINYVLGVLLKDEGELTFSEAVSELFFPSTVSTLSRVFQGVQYTEVGGFDRNQSWICTFAHVSRLERMRAAFIRLHHAANLGGSSQEIEFITLILGPNRLDNMGVNSKRQNFEVAQALSSIFTVMGVRDRLLKCRSEDSYKEELIEGVKLMAAHKSDLSANPEVLTTSPFGEKWWPIGYNMWRDLRRRVPKWPSDFTDAFQDAKSVMKVLSTTMFLYFACLLPSIAFGVLNSSNTHMTISVLDVMYAQTFAGIVFALAGGQPMMILLTTAPISIYIKTIYNITDAVGNTNLFLPMFAWTGIWNSVFLIIYALLGLSRFMRYSTRSTEEIFAIFVSIAFVYDAIKHVIYDITDNLMCEGSVNNSQWNASQVAQSQECNMATSLLYMMLCSGTVWMSVYLYNFKQTPFLSAGKRELVSDYALPGACLLFAFLGSFCFARVPLKVWNYSNNRFDYMIHFWQLPPEYVLACLGLGFSLSILFFMDQNIASAIVNSPLNKLVKGPSHNWDLFIVAIINLVFSLLGLPWVHGALPHSPFHIKALADVQERVDLSHVTQIIVKVRETRVPSLLAHILIGCSIYLLPTPLQFIPRPVLDGLFIALGVTSLVGNQLFERICLIFVERTAYPPNHYIRICSWNMLKRFTALQVVQLLLLCVFGFSPISYMKMAFPVFIMLLIPIRIKLVPKVIERKYLDCLDHHL